MGSSPARAGGRRTDEFMSVRFAGLRVGATREPGDVGKAIADAGRILLVGT